ncbi:hypothetical protein D3C83_09380 [compost metagenome]
MPDSPNFFAQCFTRCCTADPLMRAPPCATNSAPSPAGAISSRCGSHAFSASSAWLPTGTMRVFDPLPVTCTVASRRFTSCTARLVSSDNRSPDE